MAYFAKVSSDGTVLDVIVADQDFIDNNTESSDDHSYIETFMDADGKSKKYNTKLQLNICEKENLTDYIGNTKISNLVKDLETLNQKYCLYI